jgi:hypothetical protein
MTRLIGWGGFELRDVFSLKERWTFESAEDQLGMQYLFVVFSGG